MLQLFKKILSKPLAAATTVLKHVQFRSAVKSVDTIKAVERSVMCYKLLVLHTAVCVYLRVLVLYVALHCMNAVTSVLLLR